MKTTRPRCETPATTEMEHAFTTEDERRLFTATSATRPLPVDPLEELLEEIRQAEFERKAARP